MRLGAPSRFVVVPDRQGFALAVAQSLRAGGDTVDLISAQNASSLAANLLRGSRCSLRRHSVSCLRSTSPFETGCRPTRCWPISRSTERGSGGRADDRRRGPVTSPRLWFVTRGGAGD